MDKIAFMFGLTGLGVVSAILVHPFRGLLVYTFFGVLRPQSLWMWVLPDQPWSLALAGATIFATVVWRSTLASAPQSSRSQWRIPTFNVGHRAMLFFASWIGITYLMAYSQAAAEPWFGEYRKLFLMFFVSAFCVHTVSQIRWLYLAMVVGLGYIAWEMNSIYFTSGYLWLLRRGYDGLDNNGAALMLALGVPLCVFAWDGIRHRVRWAILALVPLLIHAVLSSYSRGAMLTLALTTPIYLWRCGNRRQVGGLLLVVAMMVPVMAGKEIAERFSSIDDHSKDDSAQSRMTSWGIAIRMAQERPIFGLGIRNSNLFTLQYGADIEGRTIHSQYLQIAADSGIVGLLGYVAVLVAAFWCLARSRRAVRGRTEDEARTIRWLANGIECALFAFCFGSVFLSLETFEPLYILLFLAIQLWSITRMNLVRMPVQAGVGLERVGEYPPHQPSVPA